MLTARIAHTWDGQPAERDEVASIHLARAGSDWHLTVSAPFHGDPLPALPPGPTPGLWEFEVVELFVVGHGEGPPYTEIELGPGGHHLVLQLHGIRQPIASELPIAYEVEVHNGRWHGEARIPGRLMPVRPQKWNAFAIHGLGPSRRYLAAHPVPGPQPDFHRLAAFARWPG